MTREEFIDNIKINSNCVGVDFRGCNEWIQEYSINFTECHYFGNYKKMAYYFNGINYSKKQEEIDGIAMVMDNDTMYIPAQEENDGRYALHTEIKSLIRALYPNLKFKIVVKSQFELQEIIDSLFPYKEEESQKFLNEHEERINIPLWL